MKKNSELGTITREEAIILYDALHEYLFKKERSAKHGWEEMNVLYKDLEYFIREGDDQRL